MSTKIKLEVNHGKHAKGDKASGKKLTIKDNSPIKDKQLPMIVEEDIPQPPLKQKKQKNNKKTQQVSTIKIQKKGQNTENNKISPTKKENNQKDIELQTIERIKMHEKKTKITVQQLINQYKDTAQDIFTNHGHNPEKQMIIQQKLNQLQIQHSKRLNKLKEQQQKSIVKSQNKQKQRQQKSNLKQQKRKERRKKRAQKKIQQLNSLSQERLQREAKYQQYYNNEYKLKVPRYQKYQKQFQQKQKQYEMQIKEKLTLNKNKYRPMDFDNLNEFNEKYQESKWNSIQQSQKKRQFTQQLIEQQNRQLKSKLWRGQCHKRVQSEAKQRQKIKNQGKTKLQKTKQYGTIVKQSFKPKISESKRQMSLSISKTINNITDQDNQQIYQNQLSSRFKKVAKQKYFQGKNQGLVIQRLRKSLDHDQKVKQGNSYLEYICNLPKVRKDGVQSAKLQETKGEYISPERKKLPQTTFKPRQQKNPYYLSSHSEKLTRKSESFRIKDPQTLNYLLADMKGKQKKMDLQQKSIKYGRYNSILQLQNKHNSLNHQLVSSLNQKLTILSKM